MLSDLRFVARALRRRPAFVLTAAVTLSLAIGANTAVFSVANALLVRDLPYAQPDRLVAVWPDQFLSNRELDVLRTRSHELDALAAFSPGWLMALTDTATPRQLNAARVSGNFFAMLGRAPALGRTFGPESEVPGRDAVAVLGYNLWQTSFGGDPLVVGRPIRLDGADYVVIGVMPREFLSLDAATDLWTPMTVDPSAATWAGATALAYGRLRAGATSAIASRELASLARTIRDELQLAADWPRSPAVVGLKEHVLGPVRPMLVVLLAAVALLLLIAASNVTNLMLVRAEDRRSDLAVRSFLGATPRQLAALPLVESLLLGVLGCAGGVALAFGGVSLLRRTLPPDFPRLAEIGVDGRVLGAALAASLLTSLLSGTAPALLARRAGASLRSSRSLTGGGERTRGLVVAAEIALAVVLAAGATLMGRTLVALNRVDTGLRPDHLLTLKLQPSGRDTNASLQAYWDEVLTRVEAVPGVVSAGTILHLPASGRTWNADVQVEGRPTVPGQPPLRTAWQSVSPGYFRTAGMTLRKGRGILPSDGDGAPRVAVVNTALAERVFSGEDPIGRRVRLGRASHDELATIVGVVSSVRHDALDTSPGPEAYLPFAQRPVSANSLVVRTAGDPMLIAPDVQREIASVDRDVPISDVRTMNALYASSVMRQRLVLILLGLFAGIGLALSAVGVYGVVACGVRQRFREIGIRVALGARAGSIRRLVLSSGMRHAGLGVVAGVPAALALSRLLRGLVFGVTTHDPLSFAVVALLLVAVAGGASWLPARRAARADPAEILRE